MNRDYITIENGSEVIEYIEKSKFISQVFPVTSEVEAMDIISEVKKKHYKATHNVYAFIIGETQEIQRSSDDGEPSGTAGVPVLEIIKKEKLTNVLIVVTRYFGGIKLGAGGLIRAYAHMGKVGIEHCTKVKNVLCEKIKVVIDYSHWGRLENECKNHGFNIHEIKYLDKIVLCFYLQKYEIEDFKRMIQNSTRGEGSITFLGEEFILLPL